MARVLVSCRLPGDALDALAAAHEVEIGDDPIGLGHSGLLARAHAFDALVTLVSDCVDEAVLASAPRLRVVSNCGVGVDNVDLAACRRRGVVVTNTPDVLTDATADLTFALLLAACRRVAEGDRRVRAGRWRGFSPTELLGVRVTGATLGIIGLGRIGGAVARRASGFSMRVLYTQRAAAALEVEARLGARFVPLEALLAESDAVVVSCPLTGATRGLLSREAFARMKRGSVLVNAARGPIVDEIALADALERGHLAAAALDVFSDEPRVEPRLVQSERVVLTPHIGSADRPTRETMARLSVEAVLDVLAGRPPAYRVA
jgi:glyoxylate reductase